MDLTLIGQMVVVSLFVPAAVVAVLFSLILVIVKTSSEND